MIPLFFGPEWAHQHPDETRTFFDSQASAWAKSRHFEASRAHDAWDQLGSARHGLHLDHPETAEWIRQFISAKARSMESQSPPDA